MHVICCSGFPRQTKVNRPVAADRVEHRLCAGREIDRRDVPLIITGVAGITTIRDVEITGATRRRGHGKRRRSFLSGPLKRGSLWPARTEDLNAVRYLILMDLAIQSVAVDVQAVRIHDRRRGREAGTIARRRAATSRVLLTPNECSIVGIQRDDVPTDGRETWNIRVSSATFVREMSHS